jgi:hypothetical protein
MTQLELFENYPRRGFGRLGSALRFVIASWQARRAMARFARSRKAINLADIPDYIRRDIGLPDVEPAPLPTQLIALTALRLK